MTVVAGTLNRSFGILLCLMTAAVATIEKMADASSVMMRRFGHTKCQYFLLRLSRKSKMRVELMGFRWSGHTGESMTICIVRK